MEVEWKLNNGSFLAYVEGKFSGMVSQNPPETFQAGMWTSSFYTKDSGMFSLSPTDNVTVALHAVQAALISNQAWGWWHDHQPDMDYTKTMPYRAKNIVWAYNQAHVNMGKLIDTADDFRRIWLVFRVIDDSEKQAIYNLLPTPWEEFYVR